MARNRRVINLMYAALATAASTLICLAPTYAAPILPTGKEIYPAYAMTAGLNSLPMNMILSKDGKYAIATDMGFRQTLSSISVATGKVVSHIDYNNDVNPANGLYYGLAVDSDGTIYASQGGNSTIAVLSIDASGKLTQTRTISGQPGDFYAGLSVDTRGNLYAAKNEYFDQVNPYNPLDLELPGSLVVFNASTGTQVGRVDLKTIPIGPIAPTNYPLSVATLADGSKTYVSSERDSAVDVIDTSDPTNPKFVGAIKTGSHPDALALTNDQKTLFVANANSDTISYVNTSTDAVFNTADLRPSNANLPGVSPTSIAISPDQTRLYVALGDFNAVAVIPILTGKLLGYIPSAWYPSAIVAPSNQQLIVADAKGNFVRNPNGTDRGPGGSWGNYILNIIEGTAGSLAVPTPAQLAQDTGTVYYANRLDQISATNKLANISRSAGKITHVIYIIKENRTYDQVLGDIGEGNSDPSLTLFGQNVTPNLHALAKNYVLLDNFYDAGEVSGDGWNWSTESYANESVIKDVPYNYSGRGRQYDNEGQNNGYLVGGFPPTDPYGNPNSSLFVYGAPPIPDIAQNDGGHIWDTTRAAKISLRNYGFFLSFGVPGLLPDNYPGASGLQPAGHDTGGISDIDFRGFDLSYADSDAPQIYFNETADPNNLYPTKTYGHYNAPSRFSEFKREFSEYLTQDSTGKTIPHFIMLRLMKDHTSGASSGLHTPRSMVADNDYGVGQVADLVSHSPIWQHTAIFVIEDDAQDGQDHVDAHRSTCYVISPYIKKASIDHTFYNTDSVLKTIEQLLGTVPMSQYDAIATPILDWTATPDNITPYNAILPAESIIAEHNPSASAMKLSDPRRPLALASDKMDFIHPDSAPAQLLNSIVWKTVKGVHSNPPAPKFSKVASGKLALTKDQDGD